MSKNMRKLSIQIEIRWWTRYAIVAVALFSFVTRRKVSDKTVDWITSHGFTHKLNSES